MPSHSPIQTILDESGVCIIDGGLATELEWAGFELGDKLWSAKLLMTAPEAIRDVHIDYLQAGADCIISASYQASIEAFMSTGLTRLESVALLRKSVQLAVDARAVYMAANPHARRPLIAASIGPFGAYLANGAEYTGDYGVSRARLHEFHAERWDILATTEADLMACETIPNVDEAAVLARQIMRTPQMPVWVSFSCPDATHISDGTPIEEVATLFADCPNVVALGVNCSSPSLCAELTERIREAAPDKEVVLYPNSGETYVPETGNWTSGDEGSSFVEATPDWYGAGARIIGGCCRTRPAHIRQLADTLRE